VPRSGWFAACDLHSETGILTCTTQAASMCVGNWVPSVWKLTVTCSYVKYIPSFCATYLWTPIWFYIYGFLNMYIKCELNADFSVSLIFWLIRTNEQDSNLFLYELNIWRRQIVVLRLAMFLRFYLLKIVLFLQEWKGLCVCLTSSHLETKFLPPFFWCINRRTHTGALRQGGVSSLIVLKDKLKSKYINH
jgi:hypothetical protein